MNAITRKMPELTNSGANLIVAFLNGVGRNIGKIVEAAFRLVVNFLNGIANGINRHLGEIIAAGGRIAQAIVTGVVNGLWSLAGQIVDSLKGIVSNAWGAVTDFLGIGGPSKLACTAGQYIVMGLRDGIESQGRHLTNTTKATAESVVDTMNKSFAKMPNALDGIVDAQPRITPILDLTKVKQDASQINNALKPSALSSKASFQLAGSIAKEKDSAQNSQNGSDSSGAKTPVAVNLVQNNYSPKALSAVEIYRKTKNQMSMAKEALNS
jgi:hypothetical protein